jgi:hypothetical protein
MLTKTQMTVVGLTFSLAACNSLASLPGSTNPDVEARILSSQTSDLNPQVAKLAVIAYNKAKQRGLVHRPVLTVIDYSKPSTEKRLWVVDMSTNRVLYRELVAHGKNSGGNYATRFSDRAGSLESSIGTYVTSSSPYQGEHGTSLRINGLEHGFNDNAASRAVVVHGAPYVSESFARQYGRLGLSWGCPALNPDVVKPVINEIKGGSVVFAYYPDKHWLSSSQFLRG